MRRRLNLGCGLDIRSGWVNVDRVDLPGVDMVVDLDSESWPLDDQQFDLVLAKDVLEHCARPIAALGEIHRVMMPGGELHLQVPHFTSRGAFLDPTHVRAFAAESFHYFTYGHRRSYYSTTLFSEVTAVRITFDRSPKLFWNYLVQPLVNLSLRTQRFYEMTPLRVFPALNVEVVLRK